MGRHLKRGGGESPYSIMTMVDIRFASRKIVADQLEVR
jgi:hypothetical protein